MRAYAALQPHQLVAGRPPSVLDGDGKGVSLAAIARQHMCGTPPPRPFDEGLLRNLYIFFLAPKPYPYRWVASRCRGCGNGAKRHTYRIGAERGPSTPSYRLETRLTSAAVLFAGKLSRSGRRATWRLAAIVAAAYLEQC
jgi:hypothetical protein